MDRIKYIVDQINHNLTIGYMSVYSTSEKLRTAAGEVIEDIQATPGEWVEACGRCWIAPNTARNRYSEGRKFLEECGYVEP